MAGDFNFKCCSVKKNPALRSYSLGNFDGVLEIKVHFLASKYVVHFE